MEATKLTLQIEALIFSSSQPIDLLSIVSHISNVEDEPLDQQEVAAAIDAIVLKYQGSHYPFEVKNTGNGYQFLTKKEHHSLVAQINGDKYQKKLSATAMETLAIIAYKQPVTKPEIEYIRGVSSDYAIHKLLERELIDIAGRDEDAIGRPILYTASNDLFDYLGINDQSELPLLKDINPESIVIPTEASAAEPLDLKSQRERDSLVIDENRAASNQTEG